MNKSSTHMMAHKTVLSYPGSLEEQTMSMPDLLKETRIRLCMLSNVKKIFVCIRLEFILN
jgi:hypothetical protein